MVLIIGVSYSLWQYGYIGNANTIETGDISIEYLEDNDFINVTNALPISDEDGKKQEETFDFQVTTKATRNMKMQYDLKVEKLSVDTGYNALNDNEIKIYLTDYNNNELIEPVKISDLDNYKLYTKVNTHSKIMTEVKDKYRIRAWIDSGVDASNWNENTKLQYKFRINVKGSELFPATKTLIEKTGTGGLVQMSHEADSTLQAPFNTDTTEYRYRGAEPDNYVTFNNETWRIIGIFPVDDGTGKIENRVKLIKDEPIDKKTWNDCEYTNTDEVYTCNDTGKYTNDWTGATLNSYLNGEYYDSFTAETKYMIDNSKYYLGSIYVGNDVSLVYKYERKKDESDGGNYFYETNPNSDINKIALMYISDYVYASSECDNKKLYSTGTEEEDLRSCASTNWLYTNSYNWVISVVMSKSHLVNLIIADGRITNEKVFNSYNIYPVLYLASDVGIIEGNGTKNRPYIFKT